MYVGDAGRGSRGRFLGGWVIGKGNVGGVTLWKDEVEKRIDGSGLGKKRKGEQRYKECYLSVGRHSIPHERA